MRCCDQEIYFQRIDRRRDACYPYSSSFRINPTKSEELTMCYDKQATGRMADSYPRLTSAPTRQREQRFAPMTRRRHCMKVLEVLSCRISLWSTSRPPRKAPMTVCNAFRIRKLLIRIRIAESRWVVEIQKRNPL